MLKIVWNHGGLVGWLTASQTEDRGFKTRLALLCFLEFIREIIFGIYHELLWVMWGNLHKPANQFNGVCEVSYLQKNRVGTVDQALSFWLEPVPECWWWIAQNKNLMQLPNRHTRNLFQNKIVTGVDACYQSKICSQDSNYLYLFFSSKSVRRVCLSVSVRCKQALTNKIWTDLWTLALVLVGCHIFIIYTKK